MPTVVFLLFDIAPFAVAIENFCITLINIYYMYFFFTALYVEIAIVVIMILFYYSSIMHNIIILRPIHCLLPSKCIPYIITTIVNDGQLKYYIFCNIIIRLDGFFSEMVDDGALYILVYILL